LLTVRGIGWPRIACWCVLVRFVSFRRVLGLREILVRSGPCRILVCLLESGVWVGRCELMWVQCFSFCLVYVRLFSSINIMIHSSLACSRKKLWR
jgi:hypothetical protein